MRESINTTLAIDARIIPAVKVDWLPSIVGDATDVQPCSESECIVSLGRAVGKTYPTFYAAAYEIEVNLACVSQGALDLSGF